MTEATDFWNDPKKAEEIIKSINIKKAWTEKFEKLHNSLEDLKVIYNYFNEGEADENDLDQQFKITSKVLEDLEFKKMLSGEEDKFGTILTINPGAGGTESQDWAQMLLRMYMRYGENSGYKVKTIDYQEGDVAGLKSVTIEFEGDYAYGYLKSESGVHRLVRLSPFDSANKRHTSFASVYAYPVIDDNIVIEINPAEITWDTFRSSGPGGQNVNKV